MLETISYPMRGCRLVTATAVCLGLLLAVSLPSCLAFSSQQNNGAGSSRFSSTPSRGRASWDISRASSPTRLLYETGKNSNDGKQTSEEESEEDFHRRMALVRSLQMSFYTTSATLPEGSGGGPSSSSDGGPTKASSATSTTRLDAETGKLHRLPLWRAPWWEVPGRSNVLNVHDPIYTNMFESILYKPPPWCFGHLFLEGGSRNLRSTDPKHQLATWQNGTGVLADDVASPPSSSSSAVLGALMHIKDYRRMADGRLLLLVHAMERFVVTDVHQHLPYSIADAQILPDAEEVDPHLDFYDGTVPEEELRPARAMAVQESVRFHAYEYDQFHCLHVPAGPDVTVSDISHAAIAKVLPYCPFSKTLEPPTPEPPLAVSPTTVVDVQGRASRAKQNGIQSNNNNNDEDSSSLEYMLLRRGILQVPPADPEYIYYKQPNMATDELEYQLWLALNHFLVTTKKPVSPILLGLLPPKGSAHDSRPWPDDFVLDGIAASIGDADIDHDFVPVSPDYPAHRRQRRLSFSAAYLLERRTKPRRRRR